MIENINVGETMERFGKNPNQNKKVISTTTCAQKLIAVKCKVVNSVVKSNGHRGKATSCWKTEDVVEQKTWWNRPRSTSEQVELSDDMYNPIA